MKNIVKKITLFIFSAIITLACTTAVFANHGEVSLIYDAENKSLSILGNISDTGGTNYVVNVSGYSEDDVIFSESNPPLMSLLYTTEKNGAVDKKIKLSSDFAAGHYMMHIFYKEGTENKRIVIPFYIIDENDTATKEQMGVLNSKDAKKTDYVSLLNNSDNLAKIGISHSDVKTSIEFAAEYAYDMKSGNYTVYSLQKIVQEGDIAYRLKTSGGRRSCKQYSPDW